MRALLVGCGLLVLTACASPDQVAWQRCAAAGLTPGDPGSYDCYNNEMNRIGAANAALAGLGVGLYRASQPSYPTYVVAPGWP